MSEVKKVELTPEQEKCKNIILSRKLVKKNGYYEAKVTSVVAYQDYFIVNLGLMSDYHKEKAAQLILEGKLQGAQNQNITFNVRGNQYLPSVGEKVKAYCEKLTTKNDVTGFFCTSIAELKSIETSKVNMDFDSLFITPATEEEVANTTEEATEEEVEMIAK